MSDQTKGELDLQRKKNHGDEMMKYVGYVCHVQCYSGTRYMSTRYR